MPVVVKVKQLITPLCQNSQRVLEERDDDEKAPNSRQIAAMMSDMRPGR